MKLTLAILRPDGITPTRHTLTIESNEIGLLPTMGDEIQLAGMPHPMIVSGRRFVYFEDGSMEIQITPEEM